MARAEKPQTAPANPATSTSSYGSGAARGASGSAGKAYLELCEIKTSKGITTVTGAGDKVTFQFNPKEFTVSKSANWKETVTRRSARAQYLGPSPATMTLEMFLDGTEGGVNVSERVRELMDACNPTATSTSRNRPLPPGVRFGWDKVYFEGYLVKVSAHYTLFKRDGTPIRALCTLEIKEVPAAPRRQNPTSGGVSSHGSHAVVDGDSLPSIAFEEYGDAAHWRAIAEANRIDDPMRLVPGTRLLIPPAQEAAQAS